MDPKLQPEDEKRLDTLLNEWTLDSALAPRFQEQVWEHLARTEQPAQTGFWQVLAGAISRALPRPRFAFAYVSTVLLLGVAAGSVAAQIKTSHLNQELRQRYVQSIDPYRMQTAEP
jgi:hypothetical protein